MGREALFQKDPFGEKVITITGHNLNQTQIDKFLARMRILDAGVVPDEPAVRPMLTTKKPWNPESGPAVVDTGDFSRVRRAAAPMEMEEEEEMPSAYSIYDTYVELNLYTSPYDALWIVLVQVAAVFTCYHSSKFACKVWSEWGEREKEFFQVMMQRLGFALPIALSVPSTVLFLSSVCSFRATDSCHMSNVLTKVRNLFQTPFSFSLATKEDSFRNSSGAVLAVIPPFPHSSCLLRLGSGSHGSSLRFGSQSTCGHRNTKDSLDRKSKKDSLPIYFSR